MKRIFLITQIPSRLVFHTLFQTGAVKSYQARCGLPHQQDSEEIHVCECVAGRDVGCPLVSRLLCFKLQVLSRAEQG